MYNINISAGIENGSRAEKETGRVRLGSLKSKLHTNIAPG